MKHWNELSPAQQHAVRKQERIEIIKALVEVGGDFIGEADYPVRMQYEGLALEMERMQTPWFLFEALYNDPIITQWRNEEVDFMLTGKHVAFMEPGDIAIRLPIVKQESQS